MGELCLIKSVSMRSLIVLILIRCFVTNTAAHAQLAATPTNSNPTARNAIERLARWRQTRSQPAQPRCRHSQACGDRRDGNVLRHYLLATDRREKDGDHIENRTHEGKPQIGPLPKPELAQPGRGQPQHIGCQ